jgi:muramoyltetrapeptide carboxypeptidase
MNDITYLRPGDLILIVAPAKAIEAEHVYYSKEYLEKKGYRVEIGEHCLGQHNYFSGTDEERTKDFQWAIDHPEAKAILCARGGYGSIRILDRLQWANQLRNPKWIIGFSDITVFHQLMQKMELKSIHATMPLNFQTNSNESLETLLQAIEGKNYSIQTESSLHNKNGNATGELIGGNLSIVYSLLGTEIQPDYKKKILFLEDVGEQLYALDRMFFSLKKAGVLDDISGLIIGGMTDIKDTTATTVGLTVEEIVRQHFQYRNIPICFNFPAGHITDNRALVFGTTVRLEVNTIVQLDFNLETV